MSLSSTTKKQRYDSSKQYVEPTKLNETKLASSSFYTVVVSLTKNKQIRDIGPGRAYSRYHHLTRLDLLNEVHVEIT